MRRDITARTNSNERFGIGVGGGPHTYMGWFNISGLTVFDGPAGAIGRDVFIQLSTVEAEYLAAALQRQIAHAKEQVK
jgi:hypothetical protein